MRSPEPRPVGIDTALGEFATEDKADQCPGRQPGIEAFFPPYVEPQALPDPCERIL